MEITQLLFQRYFFHFYILPTAISLCADGYVGLPVTSSPVHVFVSSSPLIKKGLSFYYRKKNDRSCCFFPSRVPIWQPQIACNCRLYNISWRARNLKQCILFFRRDMFSFLQLFIFMQKLIVTKSMYYNLSWRNMHFSPSTLL